jgi:Helix-turn-helix domain
VSVSVDWRGVRLAVGLTQREFGTLLSLSAREVRRLEHGEHSPRPPVVARLVAFLALRGPRARLRRLGIAHPFAADVARAVGVWNRAARRVPPGPARPCAVCGVPLGLHARCSACPQLLGAAHGEPAASDGLCRSCRAAARARAARMLGKRSA